MADIRLLFKTHNLSIEVVRANEESKQSNYRVSFFGGVNGSVYQKNMICWLRVRCKRRAYKFSSLAFVSRLLNNCAGNRPWLRIQRDQGRGWSFPLNGNCSINQDLWKTGWAAFAVWMTSGGIHLTRLFDPSELYRSFRGEERVVSNGEGR